ncbi:MAG: tryptophan--tRNA ligase [Eubacteriales bacterium]|nr:tryptophan--tRNA ligase [Eubacteriales bacterium]MDY3332455.1 tryptophan--tRNA ligase [Gallibacter sp.]
MGRVFSGVQPTGNIHLGNYLGAIKQFVDLQDENDCIYCIVDLHAITVEQDPKELREHILDVAALYLAVGIDPKKSIVFVQSKVPQHAELGWLLTCYSYTGELSRMTQFKDKGKGRESVPTGLFMYPTLMAADILLYDTEIVPVGIDQKQHIEITRDLCNRINNKYGEVFVEPDGRFLKEGAKIMALDDPTKKMSKSAANELSKIGLLDDDAKIKKAIMKATTDSEGIVKYDMDNKPGISNLINIYTAFSDLSVEEIEKKYDGVGYGQFKKDLVEVLINGLKPIREKFHEIRNSDELISVLDDGAKRAEAIATEVLKRAYNKIGLGY